MSRRVLVVDDDDDIRDVVQTSLRLVTGWDIQVASNGAEAIDLCRANPPDAVLLDVMMPTMDGPTTFARLLGDMRTRYVPVVLLTGKVQAAELRRWDDLGVAGVIAKPFDPVRLPEQFAELLGWRH
jgi:CheY-like chemotaxis protein